MELSAAEKSTLIMPVAEDKNNFLDHSPKFSQQLLSSN